MPDKKTPSLKKPEMYEDLRKEGASKEKAARISNAAAQKGRSKSSVGAKGGEAGSYDDWTVADLRRRAKELGLSSYSDQKKAELVKRLRQH
ncbi:SAP domain-containing protein [Aeromicrobium stalagmiti]|uniref:SAP domain-containing protein n=1 Tax=Aeromicrobium stalagmiti TaxID=2738988 RepID=UPI0015696087|nr:SAP domain-containing protein [Aeromicrobium stalagmiti]NRQ49639.1 SAP domain-containing protein [Aeromicrobium stalagmiti]